MSGKRQGTGGGTPPGLAAGGGGDSGRQPSAGPVTVSPAKPPSPTTRVHRAARQHRYLAQSILLEEGGISTLVRSTIAVNAAIVIAFVAWAALTRVQEVAVAQGHIIPNGSVRALQHLEGGIVREILVIEGQMIGRGSVLARFEPAQAIADLEQTRVRIAGLELKVERLRAFANDRKPDFVAVMGDRQYADLVADQSAIYTSQVGARAAQRTVLERQVEQRRAELLTLIEQQASAREQLALSEQELTMRKTLLDQGLASKVVYLNTQRDNSRLQGEVTRLGNEATGARKAIAEVESRLADLASKLRQEAMTELGIAAAELAQLRESVMRAQDRAVRLDLVSPVRGLVQNLRVTGIGAIVAPGATVMDIVPVEDGLLVEVRIDTRDIGHVHVDQPVTVKVTAFDYSRFGSAQGRLTSLSPSTYTDAQADAKPYFRGVVALTHDYVGAIPGRYQITPGMTVQADIVTGEKTVLEYLLKPIYVSIRSGFHER